VGAPRGSIPSFAFPENAARALGRSVAWEGRRIVRRAGCSDPTSTPTGSAGSWPPPSAARAMAGWRRSTPRLCSPRMASRWPAPRTYAPRTRPRRPRSSSVHGGRQGRCRYPQERCRRRPARVTTPAAAADAVRAIRADLESAGIDAAASELLVQEQVESGQEMIVGVTTTPCSGRS